MLFCACDTYKHNLLTSAYQNKQIVHQKEHHWKRYERHCNKNDLLWQSDEIRISSPNNVFCWKNWIIVKWNLFGDEKELSHQNIQLGDEIHILSTVCKVQYNSVDAEVNGIVL